MVSFHILQSVPQLALQSAPQLAIQLVPQLVPQLAPQLDPQLDPQLVPQLVLQLVVQLAVDLIWSHMVSFHILQSVPQSAIQMAVDLIWSHFTSSNQSRRSRTILFTWSTSLPFQTRVTPLKVCTVLCSGCVIQPSLSVTIH